MTSPVMTPGTPDRDEHEAGASQSVVCSSVSPPPAFLGRRQTRPTQRTRPPEDGRDETHDTEHAHPPMARKSFREIERQIEKLQEQTAATREELALTDEERAMLDDIIEGYDENGNPVLDIDHDRLAGFSRQGGR